MTPNRPMMIREQKTLKSVNPYIKRPISNLLNPVIIIFNIFRRKLSDAANSSANNSQGKSNTAPKKKKQGANKKLSSTNVASSDTTNVPSDGHMTAEEVERHLQSRQSLIELVPERAPATVPNEMFSNEPSLDRYAPNIFELIKLD